MYGIIYLITNKLNGKSYVGQTTQELKHRWAFHCSPHPACRLLHRAIRKYGRDAFLVEKVFECNSKEEQNELEIKCITALLSNHPQNGYNISGGGGAKKTSEGTKELQRLAKVGFVFTKEHREKISNGNKGKFVSDETRKKLSIALIGKVKSREHIKNLGAAQKKLNRLRGPDGRFSCTN